MSRPLALTALTALAAILAGCGGSGSKHIATPTVRSSSSDCEFKQITVGARREGDCVARGVAITVVNEPHWLHGKEYDARIAGVSTAKTVGGVPANGRFVIVRLAVKNTLDGPHAFDRGSNLAFLLVDKKYFSESRAAESGVPRAFRRRADQLQPDETATGTVVFDVPIDHTKNLAAEGSNLILVNYSDAAKRFPTGTQPLKALGYIRLWK